MEISIKFTEKELAIIFDALMLGSIHHSDKQKSNEMKDIMEKLRILMGVNQIFIKH